MLELRAAEPGDKETVMELINGAKRHLREQGIDQWQTGYPDAACIDRDIRTGKGFLVTEESRVLGYLCIDYDGEPAYDRLNGQWQTDGAYVVVHRMALAEQARGRGISSAVFSLVEEMSRRKGVRSFRVDTDAGNQKMQHILKKNGFCRRGTIWFDHSEKIAFDKAIP